MAWGFLGKSQLAFNSESGCRERANRAPGDTNLRSRSRECGRLHIVRQLWTPFCDREVDASDQQRRDPACVRVM